MTRFEFTRLEKLRQVRGSTSRVRLLGLVLVAGLAACAFFVSNASAHTTPAVGGAVPAQSGCVSDDGDCLVTVNVNGPGTVTDNLGRLPEGGCTSSNSPCQALYRPKAESPVFTATPDSGYVFSAWSGACSGTGTCSFPNIESDEKITATFSLPMKTLLVSVTGSGTVTGQGISCPDNCHQNYTKGTQVTLTENPASGVNFSGWGGDCSGAGTNTQCTLIMNGDRNVTATFGSSPTLTVQKAGAGTGSVTSSPVGISCGGTCSAPFAQGAQVTLTETPDAGSSFSGWGGDCSGSATTCTVTINAVKTVTATFAKAQGQGRPTLTVRTTGAGQGSVSSSPAGIACGGTCIASFKNGQAVVLTATPESKAFFFAGWKGDCSGTTSTCSLTMNGSKDVTADFEPAPTIGDAQTPQLPPKYPPPSSALSVNVSGDGSVVSVASRNLSVAGGASAAPAPVKCGLAGFQCYTTVTPGAALILLAKAGPGYKFVGWSGPCTVKGSSCQVGLAGARTVSAHFAPKVASSTFAAGLAPAPRFRVAWRASIGRGQLRVSGTVGKPALAKVQLRRPHGGALLTETQTLDAGKFVLLPKLLPGLLAHGAKLFPGGFMISLTGTSGRLKMPLQIQTVTLPAPPEGVVRTAYLSAAQATKPLRSVPASGRQAYANFVLQTQPVRGKAVTVRWYWPNGKLLGSIKKSNRPTIVSFIRVPAADSLPKGNWTAELRVGSKIVQRLLIRVR